MKLDEILNEGGWTNRKHKVKTFYLKNGDKAELRFYVSCKYGYPEDCEAWVIPKSGKFVGNTDFDYVGVQSLSLHLYDNPADLVKFMDVACKKIAQVEVEGVSVKQDIAPKVEELLKDLAEDFE